LSNESGSIKERTRTSTEMGNQLSTKWALGSDQSSVKSWPCAAN